MSEFCIGQRWISNSDANLGLGIVAEVSERRVLLSFPAAGEERVYAIRNAPLTRIYYKEGDSIKDTDKQNFTIVKVHQKNQLYFYEVKNALGETSILPELELDCFTRFNSPHDRLLSGQVDPLKYFELRYDTQQYWHNYHRSEAIGLLGPRVQLLPHQLYIAHQVGSRIHPRVLLADEVGLGKTIEAGLIIHRQITTGLANRVLIIVPDSLLHQWLVEMLRRFNLSFTLLDETQAQASDQQNRNPFESNQLILCSLSFLMAHPERQKQLLQCEWDLLVVDEAHHLQWNQQQASPAYNLVEAIASIAFGVLLLTATPEQLGMESHFARLRLLDPDRYFDFTAFVAEQEQYQPINALVKKLLHNEPTLPQGLDNFIGASERAEIDALFTQGNQQQARQHAINALLDRHGTGRILFRNTRAAVTGFPQRLLHSYALPFPKQTNISAAIEDWLQIEAIFGEDWLEQDLRVSWLVELLKQHKREKFLLICAQADTAMQLEQYLTLNKGIRATAFHEGMSLLNRDKAAAYFADTENAAQILLCSEIGSEGRNFQFAKHIVLFDLPLNADLLEQRIGRLDRIGQQHSIHIHVPFYQDTAQQTLLDWYHQGLNAFEQTCAIGQNVFERFKDELLRCLQEQGNEQQQLIEQSRQYADTLRVSLQKGRDQLLELNSCRPQHAQTIIEHINEAENRLLLEDFVEQFSDQLGVHLELHSQDAIIMYPSDQMHVGNLPGLDEEGVTATFNREIALSRDDMTFLTWESPMVQGAMHLILDGNHGNSAIATLKLKALKPGTLLLEAFYNVECIAPKQLQLGRFLDTRLIRVLVSLDGKDLSQAISHKKLSSLLERVPSGTISALIQQAKPAIIDMVEKAHAIAIKQLPQIINNAQQVMQQAQQQEIYRLTALAEVNSSIRQEEIDYLTDITDELAQFLADADLRLDAVRLIIAV